MYEELEVENLLFLRINGPPRMETGDRLTVSRRAENLIDE